MRKYLVAGLIGLSLLGTQAAAAEGTVADQRGGWFFGQDIPAFAWLYGAAFIGVIAWAASDNGGSPSSP
ncbi:hypothetical protein ACNJU9_21925, partial [Mycobacterium tuberculosis]